MSATAPKLLDPKLLDPKLPVLELKNVSKSFGSYTALEALDMAVGPGEVRAFLGPNGAGKTTTLKIVLGMMRPSSGRVRVLDVDPEIDPVGVKRRVGFLPDVPFLYDYLTCRETMAFVGRVHRLDAEAITDRTRRLFERLELTPRQDDLVLGLSKGLKKRLALATALLHSPPLLLLDEPTSGLDPGTVRLLKDLVRERAREGTAILFSTHVLAIAEEIGTHVTILDRGREVLNTDRDALQALLEAEGENLALEELFLRLTSEVRPSEAGGTGGAPVA